MADRYRAMPAPWWMHPDTVHWRNTVVEQIEALRRDALSDVVCPTCDCAFHPPTSERRCSFCDVVKPLTSFALNRSQPLGRSYGCKPCRRAQDAQRRATRKIAAFRAALSGVAS